MQFFENNRVLAVFMFVFVAILALLIANVVSVVFNGDNVEAPEISDKETTIGSGEKLKYLILGDSTAVAQGAEYEQGFAVQTAQELAKTKQVTYKNVGVSGARIHDVVVDQLERSKDFVPDLVLVAVGANDVTHLTSIGSIKRDSQTIINSLRERNKNVAIVFSGAASMGSVKRFTQPFKWFMGQQTQDVNYAMAKLANDNNVAFAYIARETGEQFAEHPEYFAKDNFHPNAEGYAVWTKVLNPVIENTLSN